MQLEKYIKMRALLGSSRASGFHWFVMSLSQASSTLYTSSASSFTRCYCSRTPWIRTRNAWWTQPLYLRCRVWLPTWWVAWSRTRWTSSALEFSFNTIIKIRPSIIKAWCRLCSRFTSTMESLGISEDSLPASCARASATSSPGAYTSTWSTRGPVFI